MMALLIGSIQTGISLLRLGDLSRYLSHAVIVGFTLGAAVLLVLDQLKHALGLRAVGSHDDHFLVRFWRTLVQGGSLDGWTVAIAGGTILTVLFLRWASRRFDVPLARSAADGCRGRRVGMGIGT